MRTEHDTWDITTSVGSTALFVAAARALEAQKPDPVAVDPFAEIFCRAVGGQWADLLDGTAPDHALKSEFGADFVNFQGVRTKYFDTYFTEAAAAGVRQIVLLAAGLDSRAYRLDWPAETVVFELDQPQVLEFKRAALAGIRPTAERREVAVDLRDDWPRALLERGFDPSSPSAWIAEGLLIYLPATAQDQLFAGIDALSAPGSHVARRGGRADGRRRFAAKQQERRSVTTAGAEARSSSWSTTSNMNRPPSGSAPGVGAPTPRHCRTICGRTADQCPSPESDAGSMTGTISLVTAIKG